MTDGRTGPRTRRYPDREAVSALRDLPSTEVVDKVLVDAVRTLQVLVAHEQGPDELLHDLDQPRANVCDRERCRTADVVLDRVPIDEGPTPAANRAEGSVPD